MFLYIRLHSCEASPLQGFAQSIAVYQNGIRLNEAFGDSVNWDVVPETAVAPMENGEQQFSCSALTRWAQSMS